MASRELGAEPVSVHEFKAKVDEPVSRSKPDNSPINGSTGQYPSRKEDGRFVKVNEDCLERGPKRSFS